MSENCIVLTEKAIECVKNVMSDDASIVGIRFSVAPGGCQGLTYSVEYISEPDPADLHYEQGSVNIYIEPRAVMFLDGMVVDHKTTAMGSTFVFNNPNVLNRCGCGMSFSTGKDEGCGSCHGCGGGCGD